MLPGPQELYLQLTYAGNIKEQNLSSLLEIEIAS